MSRSQHASAIGRISPDIVEGYETLGGAGAATGLLGVKMNELITLAVALVVRCDDCIAVHTAAAIRAGTTHEEIAEVFRIAAEHAVAHLHAAGVNPRFVRGGLAAWQIRRTEQALRESSDGKVTLTHLAGQCRLSVAHFARAFKQTTGQTPHRWLLGRRVEHAQGLLLTSDLPLAKIATACGFADQSHFTRIFSQIVGTGPGAWQRVWKE